MKVGRLIASAGLAAAALFAGAPPAETTQIALEGLSGPVQIEIDPWGISHITASNQQDLFFAQGFNAARDRLFQLEIWRRNALGLWAEIQGPDAIEQDQGIRLFALRAEMDTELNHYHREGKAIIQAFVNGVNSYIDRVNARPRDLPLEFQLLGLRPGKWTPEVVVSRHNGLFRNVGEEVRLARLVQQLGSDKTADLLNLQPSVALQLPPDVEPARFPEGLLDLYRASRAGPEFKPDHIVDPVQRSAGESRKAALVSPFTGLGPLSRFDLGSNNWVLAGSKTLSGFPLLANDPHRGQQIPSLRYWVHLRAPGWNVIGGGEPALPGVSIGHNDEGAWGLTIFSVDQEDLYVYKTDPTDPTRYRYGEGWETFKTVNELIPVKGEEPRSVTLKFSRHGPVVYEDPQRQRAYSIRASWLEPGTAPYLASLRIDQASSWTEFQQALGYFLAPSENMVWADRAGNIGWQATGITPIRSNWSGLLPVPGDGRFEWKGYLKPERLPSVVNPDRGYFASANQFNLPTGYQHEVGFLWSDSFRFARLEEVLGTRRRFTTTDMMTLQHDELSIPARTLVPLLQVVTPKDPRAAELTAMFQDWDFVLKADSARAALYVMWERKLEEKVWQIVLPDEEQRKLLNRKSLIKLVRWLTAPDARFGPRPTDAHNRVLVESLLEAGAELEKLFGSQRDKWRYGDPSFHHIAIDHPLSDAVNSTLKRRLNVGPYARGGYGDTVNSTGSSDRQTSGASFRLIADLSDWDLSLGTNNPGQSGDPDSPHYRDQFELWKSGGYFPLLFSRKKIEEAAQRKFELRSPGQH